ncbi:putative transcriptional regulator [Erysiphe neolycopersici]|uniref:Putative transcriptional regulator n=1 Tax=Erysiphe neolycopersici TaxID=212602 RepID=A0A420HWN6_9PEZI|nr:putative transcriptional regulator [Erysiphe neolycopersici]
MTQKGDPINSIIAEKLKQVAIEEFHGTDRDNLTLKSVREKVEDVLGLEKGILRREEWKDESKAIVEHIVQQLLEDEEKDQKQSEFDHSSDNGSLSSPKNYMTTSSMKQISKKRSQQTTDDVASRSKRLRSKKLSTNGEPKATDSCDRSTSEQEVESIMNNYDCSSSIFKSKELANGLLDLKVEMSSADDMSEKQNLEDLTEKDKIIRQNEDEEAMDSDMSVVIDEEPAEKVRKKKKGQKCEKGENTEVGKIAKKNDKKLSSDEEMLKKLQSQLRKCGVKTIWHFELKEYGTDTRAKICHLKKALKDIGMQGRFSEARAREIKESRELMADLEAVKEGDMKWGLKRNHKHDIREQNEEEEKISIHENSCLEVEPDNDKKEFKGKNLRNKTLIRKSSFAVQQPRQRSNALDWLGDEESSEG